MIDEQQLNEAIDRIARSSDGHLLYLYLQKILTETIVTADDSALREHNGRRNFASEIRARMAKGIEESGGSDADRRPIVFARRQPNAVKQHVPAREYFRQQQPAAADATAE